MNQRTVKTRRRRRADWVVLVERYRASGLDRETFSTREGVKPGTLGWWVSRLRRGTDTKEGRASPMAVPRSASFIPVRVVVASTPPSSPVAAVGVDPAQTGARVELVLSHGAVLRVDPEWLSERGMARVATLAKELCR